LARDGLKVRGTIGPVMLDPRRCLDEHHDASNPPQVVVSWTGSFWLWPRGIARIEFEDHG
jgi:hypothetical protein